MSAKQPPWDGTGAPPRTSSKKSFDPSDHTVADVLAYLEAHPDERDSVLALEADGKARKSLITEES